jgi:MFS family permease
MFASLFARMPAIKADLALSEGELGLALLCAAVGLIVSQPIAGALATRFGSRPMTAVGVVLYGGLVALPALAGSLPAFAVAFFVAGAGSGVMDVAMNAQGALAEERHPRAIFGSFHAGFSFGAMGGAALAGGVAALGVDPVPHLLAVGAVAIAAGLVATRWMLPPSADAQADGGAPRRFARPSGALAVLGAIALCAAISEGAVGDWSAILLAEWRGASEAVAAAGLTVFSAAMGTARLAADPLRERFGAPRLIRGSALVAAAGITVVVLPLGVALTVAGFAVAGFGLASLFPMALLLGSRTPGQSSAAGIAAVSTAGYAGFLVGPAVIGLVAEATTLPVGLAILIPLSGAVAALAQAGAVARTAQVDESA